MLNGKFFTGLPPQMIDRGSAGTRNRMESHLFWPDDTQVDTAIESRLKRRNSMQSVSGEKPLYQKQNSVVDNDVDTKKRFTREFSQSSIQFYDNLNESRGGKSIRPMQRKSVANKKMEIAEKPTNTKLDLPESIVNDAYTAAKKKQAYTSKIEFYDYVNERDGALNDRNKLRKPKMDLNDKREMELNSKNSPKLQVKRDVRSLSEEKEQHKMNNRDVSSNNMNDICNEERFAKHEENYLLSRRSLEPSRNVGARSGITKATKNREQRYPNEKEIYREPESFQFESGAESGDYERNAAYNKSGRFSVGEYENLDHNSSYGHTSKRDEPKRIIRNNNRQYYDNPNARDYFERYEYQCDEEIENRMRNVHLKSPLPPKQHYHHTSESYYDDEPHYYRHSDKIETPTNRGSSHHRFDYSDREVGEINLPYKTPKRTNIDDQPVYKTKPNNQIQGESVAKPTSPSPSVAETSYSARNIQKHLRSNLCFNNGEIIGENETPLSPTTSQYPAARRNARSSATQRVSVGLPD